MTEEQNARDIADIRANMVRLDVYKAEQLAAAKDTTENAKDIASLDGKFEKSEERRAADRRLILTALILPVIIALITIYVNTQVGAA